MADARDVMARTMQQRDRFLTEAMVYVRSKLALPIQRAAERARCAVMIEIDSNDVNPVMLMRALNSMHFVGIVGYAPTHLVRVSNDDSSPVDAQFVAMNRAILAFSALPGLREPIAQQCDEFDVEEHHFLSRSSYCLLIDREPRAALASASSSSSSTGTTDPSPSSFSLVVFISWAFKRRSEVAKATAAGHGGGGASFDRAMKQISLMPLSHLVPPSPSSSLWQRVYSALLLLIQTCMGRPRRFANAVLPSIDPMPTPLHPAQVRRRIGAGAAEDLFQVGTAAMPCGLFANTDRAAADATVE